MSTLTSRSRAAKASSGAAKESTAAKGGMNIKPRLLYPSLVVAAVSLTLLSLTGIAALTGYLPGASASPDDGRYSSRVADRSEAGSRFGRSERVAAACLDCGTVESVRVVERRGSTSGIGAIAGGIGGALLGNQFGHGNGRTVMTLAGGAGGAYLGNEVEKSTKKSSGYQVRVRMADGTLRTFNQGAAPGVSTGDRVRIENGALVRI